VYKPRDVWHTFWNATDGPARLLEVISPATTRIAAEHDLITALPE